VTTHHLPVLRIDDIEARIPIVQGGMSVGISLSGLAAAVSNEGGISVIGAAGLGLLEDENPSNYREANEQALRSEIRKARSLTDGLLGVNIMMALSDHGNLITAAIDEGVDLIFIGAGMWLRAPRQVDMDLVRDSSTKIVPIVSSARAARIIFRYWARHHTHVPDAVVIEGPKAGGHIGFAREDVSNPECALENVLPRVIEEIHPYRDRFGKSIPVIAAGGIFSGRDIYEMLQLGADGVQMGTRFVATHECDASDEFKEMYVNSTEEDMVVISSPVGLPGRAIRNSFLDNILAGRRTPFRCPWKCLVTCDFRKSPYCIARALVNARKGKITQGFAFAGLNAYRIEKIVSVKELIQSLIEEYEDAVREFLDSAEGVVPALSPA